MDVQLNFINQSNDANNSEVVIFQKNVATDFEELAVAWTVIQNCGRGDNHPFVYPMASQVAVSDSYGNFTPRLDAQPGELFKMALTTSGDQLVADGAGDSAQEIRVLNDLPKGSINALVYKAGRLLAMKTAIAPQQVAVFQFKPVLWIGVASQVVEGGLMNSAIVSSVNTEFSLLGLASADIVMSGGGEGPSARPFEFTFQNVVMA